MLVLDTSKLKENEYPVTKKFVKKSWEKISTILKHSECEQELLFLINNGLAFSLGNFTEPTRKKEYFKDTKYIAFDIDSHEGNQISDLMFDVEKENILKTEPFVFYETISSRKNKRKFRVIYKLSAPVDYVYHGQIWEELASNFTLDIDSTSKQPDRIYQGGKSKSVIVNANSIYTPKCKRQATSAELEEQKRMIQIATLNNSMKNNFEGNYLYCTLDHTDLDYFKKMYLNVNEQVGELSEWCTNGIIDNDKWDSKGGYNVFNKTIFLPYCFDNKSDEILSAFVGTKYEHLWFSNVNQIMEKLGNKELKNHFKKSNEIDPFNEDNILLTDYISAEPFAKFFADKSNSMHLIKAPAGTGKTTRFFNYIETIEIDKQIIFVVPTQTIGEQINDKFINENNADRYIYLDTNNKIPEGKEWADYSIVVTTFQRLVDYKNFLNENERVLDSIIVVDEMHEFPNYRNFAGQRQIELYDVFMEFLESKTCKALVMTATPYNLPFNLFDVKHLYRKNLDKNVSLVAFNKAKKESNKDKVIYNLINDVEGSTLIYLNDKERQLKLSYDLESKGYRVLTVSSDNKTSRAEIDNIQNGGASYDVVLTTKLLNVGVDFQGVFNNLIYAPDKININDLLQFSNRDRQANNLFVLFNEYLKNRTNENERKGIDTLLNTTNEMFNKRVIFAQDVCYYFKADLGIEIDHYLHYDINTEEIFNEQVGELEPVFANAFINGYDIDKNDLEFMSRKQRLLYNRYKRLEHHFSDCNEIEHNNYITFLNAVKTGDMSVRVVNFNNFRSIERTPHNYHIRDVTKEPLLRCARNGVDNVVRYGDQITETQVLKQAHKIMKKGIKNIKGNKVTERNVTQYLYEQCGVMFEKDKRKRKRIKVSRQKKVKDVKTWTCKSIRVADLKTHGINIK